MTASNFLLLLIFFVIVIGPGIGLPISIIFLILIVYFILNHKYLQYVKKAELIFLLVLIGLSVINFTNSHFILTLIPVLLLLIELRKNHIEATTFSVPLVFSFIVGIILNSLLLFYSIVGEESRTGLGGDVNYDSFTVYIWLVATVGSMRRSFKSSFSLKLLILLTVIHTVIVTQSKMFLLLIMCLIISEALIVLSRRFHTIRLFGMFIQRRNLLVTICVFFGVMALSFIIVGAGYVSSADAMTTLDRVNNFRDEGVYGRATANIFWFEKFVSYDVPLITGLSLVEMQEQYSLIPHNSFIYASLYAGFLHTAIVVVILSNMLRQVSFGEFTRIFPGYLLVTNTIHGMFSPIFLCMLFYWVLMQKTNRKQ